MTMRRASLGLGAAVACGMSVVVMAAAPPARADLCPYPGVGAGGGVLFAQFGWCDYPTEIAGQHMHCEAAGFGVNGIVGQANNYGGSLGFGGAGVGGLSCTWRCPDGVLAPAPNPPGAWKEYLVPIKTGFCKDHMIPNGFWSSPVLPSEGIPPVNEAPPAPGEELPPQPVPPPLPTRAPGDPVIQPTVPPPPELNP